MPLLLGIDAGTTSVKAGLFDSSGTCLAVEREEYQLDTPSVERAQLDPHVYWQACVHSVREVMQSSHADPKDVIGLAVSSQGETTITLDDKGQPLYPALVWVDNRATPQANQLPANLGIRFISTPVSRKYWLPGLPVRFAGFAKMNRKFSQKPRSSFWFRIS